MPNLWRSMEALRARLARRGARRRESEIDARTVLENLDVGVVTLDEQGVIQSANPATAGIFGDAADEFINQPISRFLVREPAADMPAQPTFPLASLITRDTDTVKLKGRREDGAIFPLEITVTEMTTGNRRLFVAVIRDITASQRARQLKNEFISTVSHELRTPLTSIRGALSLVVAGTAGDLPPQARQLVDIAHKNSERLVRLISDLLDIEKIESGNMDFRLEPLELMPLIEQALESTCAYGEEFSVRFIVGEAPPEAWVRADRDRLEQVLTNLLSNAARFSPPGEAVTIDVTRSAGAVRVTVTDRGQGVPEEFRDALFQKFTQADFSDVRQKGGTGLGLSISKAIIEKHGGRIGFEPQTAGAAFFFELPEWRAAGQPVQAIP